MRDVEFVTCCEDFPRKGYILTHKKLIQIDKGILLREFKMPEDNALDADVEYCRDSSGLLKTIPACVIPDDEVIYVDCHDIFDVEDLITLHPADIYKKTGCFIPGIIALGIGVAGILTGVAIYKLSKK